MFQQILVLWDGSELAERAFTIASDLGDVYGAELTAVCIVARPSAHRRGPRDERHAGSPLAGADRVQALFAERHADESQHGHCQLQVVYGDDVVADLLALAQEHGSDLVVVGHHREHGPYHLFPHGLTERLMETARLPVLIVGT